jgi:hypothetical protein
MEIFDFVLVNLPTSKANNELPTTHSTCWETGCCNKTRFYGHFLFFAEDRSAPMHTRHLLTLQINFLCVRMPHNIPHKMFIVFCTVRILCILFIRLLKQIPCIMYCHLHVKIGILSLLWSGICKLCHISPAPVYSLIYAICTHVTTTLLMHIF